MPNNFEYEAETRAEMATKYDCFAINLSDVRRTVTEILSQVGRFSFFDSYTLHDISHVDGMLAQLDWLIPEKTKARMSGADWLMIVLAIYFHDLGLLITRDEFANRDKTTFRKFCNEILFSGENGEDYRQKLNALSDEEREKFLYQEFVRHNHGQRVRRWIENKPDLELGYAQLAISEIDLLLKKMHATARRDLGIICESHNLDDLQDLKKYRPAAPYGDSDSETANVHYCALLLRTVDLLQITRQRAPSTLFRLINPVDPVSQTEWAKQNAVTRVRAKLGLNKDGFPDEKAQKDTIEVFANFTSENGFFGLTSYLFYARKQLERSNDLAAQVNKQFGASYEFPWRYVDDSGVETEGFLKDTFEFSLDQAKILDLLTGHTLYNESAVVIRELVQNAIDAVRLQALIDGNSDARKAKIIVRWDNTSRTLEIQDSGTGMSRSIIEKHLLRVGSSRYQDETFKEKFPNFSPISRFGIGVLSTFMVADAVDIITCHPDDEKAHHISLRSVHGKYLVREPEKRSDPDAAPLYPHGTLFRLKVRPTARALNMLAAIRRWVVVPGCQVYFEQPGQETLQIGYESPKKAIEAYINADDVSVGQIEVREKTDDGITLAYAVRWSDYFKEWVFQNIPERQRQNSAPIFSGTCVEGIAVEFTSPGFRDQGIFAIVNATGKNAPKTNVARSALEDTAESQELARKVYKLYRDAIADEIRRLINTEKFSLTWATNEAHYLATPLVQNFRGRAKDPDALNDLVETLPVYLVEEERRRSARSLSDLKAYGSFWTAESELMRSADRLVREMVGDVSIANTLASISGNKIQLPSPLLTNLAGQWSFSASIFSQFEVTRIERIPEQRRADFLWKQITTDRVWLPLSELVEKNEAPPRTREGQLIAQFVQNLRERRYAQSSGAGLGQQLLFGCSPIPTENLEKHLGVRAYGRLFVLPDQPISRFFFHVVRDGVGTWPTVAVYHAISAAVFTLASTEGIIGEHLVERHLKQFDAELPGVRLERRTEFVEAISQSSSLIFDPSLWSRRGIVDF
jgi:molecular chaperone HtpG